MADYIYTMEIRLTPDQMRALNVVLDTARAQNMNIYLVGGAIRDIVTGFPIRDLDFTVQGNALKLHKELERVGGVVQSVDDDLKSLHLLFPGGVRVEVSMARSEVYGKAGKPPSIAPATINEDLRRRDFTVNAMALSLNPGSRGLLLDPSNGVADAEAKVIRVLHNYAFLEDPSRLIRASRFTARFHWPLEERTQARYDSAKENNYIEYISNDAIGYEIEQLAYEDDPLNIMRHLEKEGWLTVLHPHWTSAKVDTAGLAQLVKTRQQMAEFGMTFDASPAVLYFLTRRLGEKDIADIQKLLPRKTLVERWRKLEDEAKELAKRLSGKEASTPSRAWDLLSNASPDTIAFLEVTGKSQGAEQKIRNFFGKWRQVKQKFPLPEMAELRITPELPEYPKLVEDMFRLMLDGKLHSHTELMKYMKPYSPPPPPPPPPPRRGRAKAAEATAPAPAAAPAAPPAKKGKGKKPELAPAVAATVPPAVEKKPPVSAKPAAKLPAKAAAQAPAKPAAKPSKPAKKAPAPKPKPAARKPAGKKPGAKKAAAKKR